MVGGVQFLMFAAKSEHTFTFFSNKFYEFKRNKKARYKKISETDLPTHNILLHAFNTPWSI